MANVYLSFLGTNDYLPCIYQQDEKSPCREPVRFVQEATIELACRSWGANDRIVIFATSEAASRNWRDNGHFDRNTNRALPREGLETRLGKMALGVPHHRVSIPEGHNEDEIWAIFEKVFDVMEDGDRVVFDITHAFRSIPLLAIVVLHYAKVMKRIELAGIYYGAFEVLGAYHKVLQLPVEQRVAPILDLIALDQLMDWTIATDRFVKSGDASSVAALAQAQVEPILRKSKGKDTAAQAIRGLGKALALFHKAMATCRGPEISASAKTLKDSTGLCRDLDLHPPFRPLFERIEKRLRPFRDESFQDGLAAVRWCLDHGLIQQGFTILEETLICKVVVAAGEDPLNVEKREIASQAFTILNQGIVESRDKWLEPARSDPDAALHMMDYIRSTHGLVKQLDRVRQARNDLNHAGYKPEARKLKNADGFAHHLADVLKEIETLPMS